MSKRERSLSICSVSSVVEDTSATDNAPISELVRKHYRRFLQRKITENIKCWRKNNRNNRNYNKISRNVEKCVRAMENNVFAISSTSKQFQDGMDALIDKVKEATRERRLDDTFQKLVYGDSFEVATENLKEKTFRELELPPPPLFECSTEEPDANRTPIRPFEATECTPTINLSPICAVSTVGVSPTNSGTISKEPNQRFLPNVSLDLLDDDNDLSRICAVSTVGASPTKSWTIANESNERIVPDVSQDFLDYDDCGGGLLDQLFMED